MIQEVAKEDVKTGERIKNQTINIIEYKKSQKSMNILKKIAKRCKIYLLANKY